MFAKIAAVLFGIALLLELLRESFGPIVTVTTLTTAGLLFAALHLSGFGSAGWRRSPRRR